MGFSKLIAMLAGLILDLTENGHKITKNPTLFNRNGSIIKTI